MWFVGSLLWGTARHIASETIKGQIARASDPSQKMLNFAGFAETIHRKNGRICGNFNWQVCQMKNQSLKKPILQEFLWVSFVGK